MVLFAVVVLGATLAIFSLAVGTASAQPVNTTAPNTTDAQLGNDSSAERISEELVLVSKEYDGKNQTAIITLRADGPVAVTLTDVGGFQSGGRLETRTDALDAGTHTIRMPVTETDNGAAGLTITTSDAPPYAVPLSQPFESANEWGWMDALTSPEALGWGALAAFSWFALSGLYVLFIEGGKPEVAR